ncbi:hypothetical protein KHP60_09875 [Microvirga sp. 3-52]|uniref:hypothetical protein n=1 Tax=Microvirga sp. 3-52 TaxID=2792425 RepID=UPI001AD1E774|nr:hypothetical protein [Microvirga sp. 3-52]MBO1905632.1 hypothetical protein [Microvirga sp. 3-52]MBS7452642.1 hypothetical protein [Microvirga sp. 3-52]
MTCPKLKKLRYALVHTASYAEKKKLKYLNPGMEAQRQRVMAAIGRTHRLYGRMSECGSVDDWDNIKYCGVPLCPRCFMDRRRRETARAAKKTFAGIQNEGLVFLTLLAPVRVDINKVEEIQREIRNRLRNIIAYRRRHDARWNDVQLTGWWEMERITWSDFDKLGPHKRSALEKLDWPLGVLRGDATVWCPHLHAIVALGNVTREEFADALRSKGFDKPFQVDVRRFNSKRAVGLNIQSVVRYSLKFRIEQDLPGTDEFSWDGEEDHATSRHWWSDKDIRTYVEWLMRGRGNGFERLRVFIGQKKTTLSDSTVSGSDHVSVLLCDSVHDISIQDTNWLSAEAQPDCDDSEEINCDAPRSFPFVCSHVQGDHVNEGDGCTRTEDQSLIPEGQNKTVRFQLLRKPQFAEQCQCAFETLSADMPCVPSRSTTSVIPATACSMRRGNTRPHQPPG